MPSRSGRLHAAVNARGRALPPGRTGGREGGRAQVYQCRRSTRHPRLSSLRVIDAEITIIVDLIYVLEYQWGAVWCLHGQADAPAAEAWGGGHARRLLAGAALDVDADPDKEARSARLRGVKRKGVDDAIGYLTNKAGYLRYDTALASGFPIATGVIEAACRRLVKDRLDITGARWGLAGAEAVLKLRALGANDDFDAYWRWHEQQEFTRNH